MRPSVAIPVFLASVVAGTWIGLPPGDEVAHGGVRPADIPGHVRGVARRDAAEAMRQKGAARRAPGAAARGTGDIEAAIADHEKAVRDAAWAVERIHARLDNLVENDPRPGTRGEADVVRTAFRLLEPVTLSKLYGEHDDPDVRRHGIELLREPLRRGDREAMALAAGGLDDEPPVRDVVLRTLRDVAEEQDGLAGAFRDSGLTARLVGLLDSRGPVPRGLVLRVLTALRDPAAVREWREVYVRRRSVRDRVRAARALADLGSPGELAEIREEVEAGLGSEDAATRRRAEALRREMRR